MSQAAALFLTAQQNANAATTACAKNYHLGQRDAFEAVFRACFDLDDEDVAAVARDVLATLPRDERDRLMDSAQDVLRARRRETRAESICVVV